MRSFYNRCDTLIKDWLKNDFDKTSTYQNDPFLSEQKKPNRGLLKPEYIELMPEPFFGDPDNNLAVILNLNPGYGLDDKKSIGKSKVKNKLCQGYSAFAKNNPYLSNCNFHPNAYNWWKKRYDWLKTLLGYNEDDRKPFTLEFCPWHSSNWSEARINTINFIQKTSDIHSRQYINACNLRFKAFCVSLYYFDRETIYKSILLLRL